MAACTQGSGMGLSANPWRLKRLMEIKVSISVNVTKLWVNRIWFFCRVRMEEANLPKPSRTGLCDEASYVVGGTRYGSVSPKCGDLTGNTCEYWN